MPCARWYARSSVCWSGLALATKVHENGEAQLATYQTREEAEHLVVEIQIRGVRATLRAS
jgi:hypothetical protein